MGRMKVPAASTSGGRANLLPPYQKGQSGNPKGRPMNSRQKLTEGFINDLSKYYEVEGASLIKRVGDEQPAMLLQVIARLLPKDINLNVADHLTADISAEQRRRIAESWILSQGNAPDVLEGEAVRVVESEPVAALPNPDSDQDDDDDLDRIVPERECEPAQQKQDDDLFDRGTSRQYQPRPQRRAKIISTGVKRND